RGAGDTSGARIEEVRNRSGQWNDFTKWAWNENWIGLPDALAFVPKGGGLEQVDSVAVSRICREVLVDNVRGQAPVWRPDALKTTSITMRILSQKANVTHIEYTGSAHMESGANSYQAKIYGQGFWHPKEGRFDKLNLVATGMRAGAWQFNQRENDRGPAPMGVSLSLYRP
ncbi:MAG: hypothetical protein ABL962_21750, partial [Fimbriimonadaceae bacterium]